MHNHLLPLPLLSLCGLVAAAGPHWSLAEDLFAFPKYRVSFLNGLPVLNETAERWFAHGLKGGEREFLDQQWHRSNQHGEQIHVVQSIESGDANLDVDSSGLSQRHSEASGPLHQSPNFLQRMRMADNKSFICLIPPPTESHTKATEESVLESLPLQTFGLLNPLSNSCIYHRQGWFTYAYCHNNQVRQFREMAHSHPHHAGFVPEEDPEWEAFTLGQAISTSNDLLAARDQKELTTAQREAIASNIDVVQTAGHRYLVQRWGDGTMCDKTGRPREIEVQFHCSQDLSDTILFVKETSTCHYIMVINTPRLCGEPGFRTRLEQREEASIRCREVLNTPEAVAEATRPEMGESSHPLPRRSSHRKQHQIERAPHTHEADEAHTTGDENKADNERNRQELMRKAIRNLFGDAAAPGGENTDTNTFMVQGEDGDVLVDIQFVDLDNPEGEVAGGSLLEQLDKAISEATRTTERLEEILRAAGMDVVPVSTRKNGEDHSEAGGFDDGQDQAKRTKSDAERKHEEL